MSEKYTSKEKNVGSIIILAVLSLAYLLPLCLNWSQYDALNPPNSASWLGSAIVLLLAIIFLRYNKKYRWLCLPTPGRFMLMLGIVFVLSLLSCPLATENFDMLFHSVALSYSIVCVAWLIFRRFYYVILLPVLFFGMIEVGAYIQYKTFFNSVILSEALQCSREELMVYITPTNILLLLVAIVFLAGMLYWLSRIFKSTEWRALLGSVLALLSALYILYPLVPNACASLSGVSINGTYRRITRSIRDVKRASNATVKILDSLPSPAAKPSSLSTLKGDEGCVVILHIGESVRADRMGVNGYSRNTTPHLSANPNAISWKRCIAATPLTVTSLSTILTDARRWDDDMAQIAEEMRPTCGSVLDLFVDRGFDVRCFFGAFKNRSARGDSVLFRLTANIGNPINYATDDVMDAVENIKQQLASTGTKNQFFLINNEGSHTPFSHYDQANPPFIPSMHALNPSAKHEEAVRNAYDNTIHYTDLFVKRVMDVLGNRPFVYIYVSDHGEYLGDYGGTWGRGRACNEKNFFHSSQGSAVAAFAVISPEFKALHPHFASAAEQLKRSAALTIAHEHFFHTLLGLVGIQSPYYKASLDLSSPMAQPYTGPMPQDWPEYLKDASVEH